MPKLGSKSKEWADLRQDLIKEAAKEILLNEDFQSELDQKIEFSQPFF